MLENLDRIVAGEKLKDDAQLDKETKAALELTREMTSWPKSPTKEFAADLKARVTHQVVEQKSEMRRRTEISSTGIFSADRPGNDNWRGDHGNYCDDNFSSYLFP